MIQCPCGIARDDCDYHKPVIVQSTPGRGSGRGSGRTTRQLQALPKGGWYFCANRHHALNMKHLANKIGRSDIIMKDVNDLRDYDQFHGYWISGFDIDHYAQECGLDADIIDGASKLISCVKPLHWIVP